MCVCIDNNNFLCGMLKVWAHHYWRVGGEGIFFKCILLLGEETLGLVCVLILLHTDKLLYRKSL